MQIEPPTNKLMARVKMTKGSNTQWLNLYHGDQGILIGRRQNPIKKVKDHKERPVRDYIIRDTKYISNDHCLLGVEPLDIGVRVKQLLGFEFFSLMPVDVIKMVIGYEMDTFRLTLQDLGSLGNTYLHRQREVMRQQEVFMLERTKQKIGIFQIHYFHQPEPKQLFPNQRSKQNYYASKTQRLFNLLRNTHPQQCHMSGPLLPLKSDLYNSNTYDTPNKIIALNELLYNSYFIVIAFNYRSHVWVGDRKDFEFSLEGFEFRGEVLTDKEVRVESRMKMYNRLGVEKEGQSWKASPKYPVRRRETMIMADARVVDFQVMDVGKEQ